MPISCGVAAIFTSADISCKIGSPPATGHNHAKSRAQLGGCAKVCGPAAPIPVIGL